MNHSERSGLDTFLVSVGAVLKLTLWVLAMMVGFALLIPITLARLKD